MPNPHPPHYPPFGSSLPNRSWSDGNRGYRFGFNGKEKDSETASDNYDFGARIYDGRLGRWLSLDPLMRKYSNLTPYNFINNNPIVFIDKDGRDFVLSTQFINSSFYQPYLKSLNNMIVVRLITFIKEDVELTAINPKDDPSLIESSSADAYYSLTTCAINFNPLQEALLNSSEQFILTFTHELIHKKLETVIKNMVDENGQLLTNYDSENENLAQLIKKYPNQNSIIHHEWIAKYGRKDMIDAMKYQNMDKLTGQIADKSGKVAFDVQDENGVKATKEFTWTSDQYYEALSWQGLNGTTEYTSLTSDTKLLYTAIIAFSRGRTSIIEAPIKINEGAKVKSSKSNKKKAD